MKKILKNLTHKYVLIPGILSIACLIPTILLFANDRIFFCSLMAFVTFFFMWLTYNQFNSNMADDNTSEYLESGKDGQALIDEIRKGIVLLEFIDSEEYFNKGVKFIATDKDKRFSLILTDECLYEGVYGSYNFPEKSAKTINFSRGSELVVSRKSMVDEAGMAKAGMMVGGLTVGAMNYADAKRINESGGMSHSHRTGQFYMRFKVKGEGVDLRHVIVRKDYVEKFGKAFSCLPINEGKYYNIYKVELVDGGANCTNAAKALNEILKYAVENK